ncbi:MAG: alkaline phosphatase D family protein [Pseudomonadota bacterium]
MKKKLNLNRRQLLKASATSASILTVPQAFGNNLQNTDELLFKHGVASGDPLFDAVIIWTRISGDGWSSGPVDVEWRMATDPEMLNIVAQGSLVTDETKDYTVKVDVQGLEEDSTYYYQFYCLGQFSIVGRTKTAPEFSMEQCRFAVVSCANFSSGYYNVYEKIAGIRSLDAVIHLGDYIYEYGPGEYGDGRRFDREPEPADETITLTDYRMRYAQYRRDSQLQDAHQQHPFITIWDDHEFANDAWKGGAENHSENSEGLWELRKANALQAYFEWMPIRQNPENPTRGYRHFRFADLVSLSVLDTRLEGRDQQPNGGGDSSTINDPNRTLLGDEQENWLYDRLAEVSGDNVQWKLLGQQVMLTQQRALGQILSVDAWDGYAASRENLLNFIQDYGIDNTVILTGDIHTSWANDVAFNPYDSREYNRNTGEGSLAVEFITPAVTSPGITNGFAAAIAEGITRSSNPHVKYVNLSQRGFILVEASSEKIQSDWYHIRTIETRGDIRTRIAASYVCLTGTQRLQSTNNRIDIDLAGAEFAPK